MHASGTAAVPQDCLVAPPCLSCCLCAFFFFFFFNDTAPTEISPLPLHDALPILLAGLLKKHGLKACLAESETISAGHIVSLDRQSTRLNSSHGSISYAVFCF